MCEDPRDTINRAKEDLQGAGKNFERNVQNLSSGLALMASGDFNNAGRTLLDLSMMAVGGGFVNPDDVDNATGSVTAAERKMVTAREKAQEDAINAAEATRVAEAESLNNQVKSLLKGVTENQKRSPGRAVSLLNNTPLSTSLLG